MNTKTAVIIDDELPARELIKVFLEDFSNITIIGEAENGFTGAKLVNDLQPDLVFLDIQMPKIDGFEMLELLDNQPEIIFCTAFDQHAIKAFDKNAVDYLLKPFSKIRFREALQKLDSSARYEEEAQEADFNQYHNPLVRIVVKDRKEIVIIDVNKLNYLEAQDDYVELHTAEGKWLKQQTMKYYEHALEVNKFIRIHRRYIVNIDAIAKLDKLGKETYMVVLKTGESLNVSTIGYKKLKVQLGL